jgi:hypothetical protein
VAYPSQLNGSTVLTDFLLCAATVSVTKSNQRSAPKRPKKNIAMVQGRTRKVGIASDDCDTKK